MPGNWQKMNAFGQLYNCTHWNTLLLHLESVGRHFQSCSCCCYILSGYALFLCNAHSHTRRDHFQLQSKPTWELQLLAGSPTHGTQLLHQQGPTDRHTQCPTGQGERPQHDLPAEYPLPPVLQSLPQLCHLMLHL